MNAIARIPAHSKANGTPLMPFGTLVMAICSRMPANIHKARVKPSEVEKP